MTPPQDPLDTLLDQWGQPPPQSTVSPEVWQRLAHLPAAQPVRVKLPWWRSLDLTFGQTSFAAAFVVACTLLGLFLAEVRVSQLRSHRDQQLAESYLRLIDPLLADTHATKPHAGS
jgi:hypothetical protein